MALGDDLAVLPSVKSFPRKSVYIFTNLDYTAYM
jgi:hypothetical protein